jgi:Xaa-Pro aminopeptidase
MYEYEIEAEIARVFRSHHLTEAYPSIVSSGPNTCILHYSAHTRQLQSGDLVLIDAGAEYMGYASDMTRTFSVSGFTPRQLAVYSAVERVKKIAENTLSPGISLTAYELIVRTAMNDELRQLGLISQDASEDEIIRLSRKYYPHRTSHFLGLDVHDVGSRDAILAPGMVVTIEPGIYIPDEQIGVRIEDDYLITESGCERLS